MTRIPNTALAAGALLTTPTFAQQDGTSAGQSAEELPDGEMAGLVVEVGGFRDMGDKHVFIHKDDLQIIDGSNAEEAHFLSRA